ncbi:NAD(P)/FAD-dependent oxidoreductase [Sphingopyxis sp. LK2115]|jgi:D-arginine dehydrogenase|uniref:NAD(P)/FAD-dependent oxidoreductase n=1 Tax=Sphingopyxis sp. LK2115 TaxID=2744558 RepID=UPI0016601861|nr:FAD-dependent oxidoreductase [Sphingopyxis sp. LK2115]
MTAAAPSATDVLIVGAGIAGASLAAALAPWRRVLLVEAEDAPGYHATGRSAAFWHESYGGAGVQPLTRASFEALDRPHADFAERGFLTPRGALTLGRAADAAAVDAFADEFRPKGVAVERISGNAVAALVPGLRPQWCEAAYESGCRDIDVGRLHAAYLRAAKRAGAQLVTRASMRRACRVAAGWVVEVGGATIHADLLVNAAGAWADRVAAASGIAPLGIRPCRRTMVQLRLGVPTPAALPLVIDIGGDFYFKGESEGRIWLTPHDETPVDPHDVAPEDIDVATAIDRLQSVVDWPVAAVERKWAGLRSFAPDRLPVFGSDPHEARFIWCAGQGGFGIQTAPAIAGLLAAQLGAPEPRGAIGRIDPSPFAASRFA